MAVANFVAYMGLLQNLTDLSRLSYFSVHQFNQFCAVHDTICAVRTEILYNHSKSHM